MSKNRTNILNLSESALNLLKKSDLHQKILDLKGKVVVDANLNKFCEKICGKLWQRIRNSKVIQ